ncbi:MAG: hypothetical protein WC718_09345 [Phycisphaerales bacterium]
MSQIAADIKHTHGHGHPSKAHLLREDNITLPRGAGRGMGVGLMGVGILLSLVVLIAGLVGGKDGMAGLTLKHAIGAYFVGSIGVLAMCLGNLFLVLAFHLTNAGWVSTIRRQAENIASYLPLAFLLVLPGVIAEIAFHGRLFLWLNPAFYGDEALIAKQTYFFFPLHITDPETHKPLTTPVFPVFFVLRTVLYGVIWTYLSRTMAKLSRQQDETGDVALSARARFTASWGMVLFALSTAFAGFDYLMSMDFKFFSTMWGVYFFAGAIFSGTATLILTLARLKGVGKLQGVVTKDHFHDLGKLLFAFTVFWAYISFSQYFLIWYSNIPEETAFYLYRSDVDSPWKPLSIFLMLGHFVAPFLILLFRGVKQRPLFIGAIAVWAIFVHMMDMYWIVRPMVNAGDAVPQSISIGMWADILGIIGPLLAFVGYLIFRVPASCLVCRRDPYMDESLAHHNYV